MSTDGFTRAAAVYSRAPLLGLAALLGAVGCTSVNSTAATFEDTTWQVTAINGDPTPASDMYRISFEDGRIGGRFGCNQFGGPYRVEGEFLVAGDIASTLIGCPEPQAAHESQAFAVLRQPMRLQWHSGQRLTLSNSGGSITLETSATPG